MNNNGYIFDKRKMKKLLIKYGIMFLIIFPILLTVNILLQNIMQANGRMLLLMGIAFILIISAELILKKIATKREKKESQDVVVVKVNGKTKTYTNKNKKD